MNKCASCVDRLCWRYLYAIKSQWCTMDELWGITLCYWLRVVKTKGMSQDVIKRSVISHLRVYHGNASLLDRKRVLNMHVYRIIKYLLLHCPGQIMSNPRVVKQLLNQYERVNVKKHLPRPPRVESVLGGPRSCDVIEIMQTGSI